ncbi:MAG: isopentenyl phosphate kinase [Archaeoglobales archaeon]|nr:isopentenyl phosphate kinase [Archaeoglobales archaeon]
MEQKLKILKLGGAIVTDKSIGAFEKFREDKIIELCETISENYKDLILVHGAGSFGHPHVQMFGLKDPLAISKIHNACLKLNYRICDELVKRNVPVLPIHPLEGIDLSLICKVLSMNFLPVLHGDVKIEEKGFRVISGDEIAVKLAKELKAKYLGFATDVEGIYINGRIVDVFDRSMIKSVGISDAKTDVTGGMRKKLEMIFELDKTKVFIFKGTAENVRKFLNLQKVGTMVI